MARPKKLDSQRRKHPRSTRYSDAELVLLEQRAMAAGMDTAEFLREISLRRQFASRPPLGDAEFLIYLRGELGRMNDKLGQLLTFLNGKEGTAHQQQVDRVLDQLETVNGEVLKLLRYGHSGKE